MLVDKIKEVDLCECGAVTLEVCLIGEQKPTRFSMKRETFDENLGHLDIDLGETCTFHCCDHCVSHWGVDICACGSGQDYEECDAGLSECGSPFQSIQLLLEALEED